MARDPYLRAMTLYAAVANLAYTGNLALVVVFLVRVVGLGSAAVGLLLAAGGIGGVLGALGAPRLTRAFGTARALVLASLGAGLSGLLIPLTGPGPRLACYLAGSVLIAGGISVGNVIAGSFRQEYCPPAMLGRASASMRFLAYGMIPLGALFAGALGTALGVRNALWIVQVIFAASALFLLTPTIRTARSLPATPRPRRPGKGAGHHRGSVPSSRDGTDPQSCATAQPRQPPTLVASARMPIIRATASCASGPAARTVTCWPLDAPSPMTASTLLASARLAPTIS